MMMLNVLTMFVVSMMLIMSMIIIVSTMLVMFFNARRVNGAQGKDNMWRNNNACRNTLRYADGGTSEGGKHSRMSSSQTYNTIAHMKKMVRMS